MGAVSGEEFDQIASGLRWSARNLKATRAVVVDGQSFREAADTVGMTPQQARVLQTRFLKKIQEVRAVKVSPDDYIATLATVDVFKPALTKLRRRGLNDSQLLDYLKQNDVTATAADLAAVLGDGPAKTRVKRHENRDPRKSKRRRR